MTPEERGSIQLFGNALYNSITSAIVFNLSFGIAMGLFIIVMHLSIRRALGTLPRKIILATNLTTYLLHAVTIFSSNSEANGHITTVFIHPASAGSGAADLVSSFTPARWAGLIQLITNDCIVIWRTWVLYPDQRWPRVMLCFLLTGFVGFFTPLLALSSKPATPFSTLVKEWSIPYILYNIVFCLSLLTNLIATLIIHHRLRIQRQEHRLYLGNTSSMTGGEKLLLVLVQFGLVFCALQAIALVLHLVTPFGLVTVSQIVYQLLQGCFWAFMPFYSLIIFIFVHSESSTVETMGFSDALMGVVSDVEHPPDESVTE